MTGEGTGNSLARKLCSKAREAEDQRDEDQKAVGYNGWISLRETSCSLRFVAGCFYSLIQAALVTLLDLKGSCLSGKELSTALLIYV